ncbi:hypothetical protein HDV05_005173 [Chytridiales sp. JEL 0842]|nr:hypothetical protein HDV05_005173 [Chytridiales sp. JEL 0842]
MAPTAAAQGPTTTITLVNNALNKTSKSPLPVTLLSGFLGAGKTTLLKEILLNKQNLKCAVIVNDMSSINIDAALVSKASLIQKEEKLVQFENGCICCTLRGDLLVEVAKLAQSGEFDYLVIESTGISEPMQVAETFAMSAEELQEMQEAEAKAAAAAGEDVSNKLTQEPLQSLVGVARLDTCVTVIDASNFLSYFDEAKFLGQKFDDAADKTDDRTVSDLLIDQVEFANVIILNKTDMLRNNKSTLYKIEALIKKLNPKATVLKTNYSKVDLKTILNTGSFNYEEAQEAAGWLQSLKEDAKPETEEYGISSFVFRARRPFHSQRLFDCVQKNFIVMESPSGAGGVEEEEDGDEDGGACELEKGDATMEVEEKGDSDDDWVDEDDEEQVMEVDQDEARARLNSKRKSVFGPVFRSKGFLWLATKRDMGEWSQAGLILTLHRNGPWFVDMPEDQWPQDDQIKSQILKDFHTAEGGVVVGDKRQEIVFIGQFREKQKMDLVKKLRSCLLNDEEWAAYLSGKGVEGWTDPWEEWDEEDVVVDGDQEMDEAMH